MRRTRNGADPVSGEYKSGNSQEALLLVTASVVHWTTEESGFETRKAYGTFPLHSTRSGTRSAVLLEYRSLDVSRGVKNAWSCTSTICIRLHDVLLNGRERCYVERGVKIYREDSGMWRRVE